ncbi:MAG TPA: threonine/serine exporter family protein [Phycisphaerales bacterium]|nr:threonine/serine exporter family protein [Phycisphaerales bacterium]
MGALTIFVSIGFGVAMGRRLGVGLFGAPGDPPESLGPWAQWTALGLAPFGLAVLFQASPRDPAVILHGGVVGFLGARQGAAWLGPELGVCIGAFAVGLASNTYARLADRPAAVLTVPGLMLLVPAAWDSAASPASSKPSPSPGSRLPSPWCWWP